MTIRVMNMSDKPVIFNAHGKQFLLPPKEDKPGYWTVEDKIIQIQALEPVSGQPIPGKFKNAMSQEAVRHDKPVPGAIRGNVIAMEDGAAFELTQGRGLDVLQKAGVKRADIIIQDQVVNRLDDEITEKQTHLDSLKAAAQLEMAKLRAELEMEKAKIDEERAKLAAEKELLAATKTEVTIAKAKRS